MPQKTFPEIEIKKESTMGTVVKTVVVIGAFVASFAAGYYTSSKGFKVVDASGKTVVKSNAAETVKDENSRLGREVIGKSVDEAETILHNGNRTLFVGVKDGVAVEYKGQKTFTNLTVEVKDGKVVKVLGWY